MYNFIYQEPYSVVLILIFAILVLFGLRYFLINQKGQPRVLIGNAQYIGTRQEQEDSFSTAEDKKVTLAVLADGMGGYSNGKLASSLAVDTFIQGFLNAESIYPVDQFLLNNANICNRAVLDKAKGKRMGSTIIAALISQGNLYWASIGDSAIVLFKNGEFINLNKKHIFEAVLEDQYVSGKITEDQLLSNPLKKRVTSYIGAEVLKEIDMNENPIKLRYGDKVLLCSDGVYNSMTEIEMEKILSKKNEPFNIAEEIIDTIRKKNLDKQDNATVVVLEYRS